jgi:hypothetical protein
VGWFGPDQGPDWGPYGLDGLTAPGTPVMLPGGREGTAAMAGWRRCSGRPAAAWPWGLYGSVRARPG